MKKNKRWLYIPIETKVRELHGKLFLASIAAVSGFDVIIGSKIDINSRSSVFPKGTIFNVGLAENLAQNAKRFKNQGHRVAAIDEEGISILREELYLRHRVSKKALKLTDIFFCWGGYQKSIIEKKVGKRNNCKLFITGNPRFDMLRSEYKFVFNDEVKMIKKKYGKIILINTNFGFSNHFAGGTFLLESLKNRGWMKNEDDKKYFIQYIKWQKEIHKRFLEIIPVLSETYKEYNVIIRPHPSENHETWKQIEKNYSNVSIIHSGNVIPWLVAADVLIHNGCTTALEAFLLGTKVVAYRPFIVNDMEAELPNKISLKTHSKEELISLLNKILIEKIDCNIDSKESNLDYYLSGFDKMTASEGIISVLNSTAPFNSRNINKVLLGYFEFASFIKKIIVRIVSNEKNSIDTKYLLHKTPNITKNDILKIINKLSQIHKEFSEIQVEHVKSTCYHIYKE